MKRQASLVLAIALFLVMATSRPILAADPSSSTTVGQFVARLATLIGPSAPTMTASRTTKSNPVVRVDANAPLTFGAISQIAADLGVSLKSPANPMSPVSAEGASAIAGVIAMSYAAREIPGSVEDPPNQCLSSENRGVCVDCCKAAVGATGQFCGRFCHANVPPPPSPGEPSP